MTFQEFSQLYNFTNQYHAFALFVQADFETGGFKSRLCVELNNLFGMGVANKRPQSHLIVGSESIVDGGYNRKVAVYASKGASIQDRVELDNYNSINAPFDTVSTYAWILQVQSKGYATSSTYVKNYVSRYNYLAKQYGVPSLDNSGSSVEDMGGSDVILETRRTWFGRLRPYLAFIVVGLFVFGYFYYRKKRKK